MLSTQELVDGFSPLHLSVIHSKIPTLKMMLNSCDADQRVQLLQCTDWSMWTPVTWSVQPKIVNPNRREFMESYSEFRDTSSMGLLVRAEYFTLECSFRNLWI